ncbi:hypothetical protein EUGRSUZ_G01997 [Eucalyptus grandis]|uniref:Uncharacterized protein n=2 Tax=Eucalyptus grandis TaxID=71139 RepID=A0ACC3K5Z0_EUCGR|nr:hypothetical protein EUGRSUZ_G01997 [Eucalyptus grandis]
MDDPFTFPVSFFFVAKNAHFGAEKGLMIEGKREGKKKGGRLRTPELNQSREERERDQLEEAFRSGPGNLCRSLSVFPRARSRPSLVPFRPPTGLVYKHLKIVFVEGSLGFELDLALIQNKFLASKLVPYTTFGASSVFIPKNHAFDLVETIPETFQSVQHYLGSQVYPLLEETRASLCSSLENISSQPFTEVTDSVKCTRSGNTYAVKAGRWSNESNTRGKETYKTLPGDILILTDAKPATVPDLERSGRRWVLASVKMIGGDNEENKATSSTNFTVMALLDHEVNNPWKPIYAIFLTNIATNRRIWDALHMSLNLDIVKEVLCTDLVADKVSNICITKGNGSASESLDERFYHDLNESQKNAVVACLNKLKCENKPSVKLIWGPPGTGKATTVATLLFTLMKRKRRTIVCAPTHVAIKGVASRVLKLLKQSDNGLSTEMKSFLCYFDMLIFGNKERLKLMPTLKKYTWNIV